MWTCIRTLPLGAALLLVGCVGFGDFGPSDAYKEDFHSTHPLSAGGTVSIETFNGTIEADDIDGNANMHTSNGSIRAELAHGSFEGFTSNGSINARLNDPSGTWPVRAESSNGHIELTVDAKQMPEIRASTSNSSIVLRLPASANARVRANTSHSSVTSEFDGLHDDGGRRHSELHGTL